MSSNKFKDKNDRDTKSEIPFKSEQEHDNNILKCSDGETKINLAETASLGRDKSTDESQEGYNFVGALHKWTTSNEQDMKVNEIESVTGEQTTGVSKVENKRRCKPKNIDK